MGPAHPRGGRSPGRDGHTARFEASPWQAQREASRRGPMPMLERDEEDFVSMLREAARTPTGLKRGVRLREASRLERDGATAATQTGIDRMDRTGETSGSHPVDPVHPCGGPSSSRSIPPRDSDPWALDGPSFGERARKHALSGRPGTPPCGNLAVQVPQGYVLAYRGSSAKAAEADRKALAPLAETLRVEIELECPRTGKSRTTWVSSLALMASSRGLEVTLGRRSAATRELLEPGRRVNLLVTPPMGSVFEIAARVIRADPSPEPGGPLRVQILVDSSDARALGHWESVVDRATCPARARKRREETPKGTTP